MVFSQAVTPRVKAGHTLCDRAEADMGPSVTTQVCIPHTPTCRPHRQEPSAVTSHQPHQRMQIPQGLLFKTTDPPTGDKRRTHLLADPTPALLEQCSNTRAVTTNSDAAAQHSGPAAFPLGRQCLCASEPVSLALLATQNPNSDCPTGRVSPVYHRPPWVGQLFSLTLHSGCVLQIADLDAPLHEGH